MPGGPPGAITFPTENVSAPEEILFELISETAFLHGGWEELIQKTRVSKRRRHTQQSKMLV